MEFAALALGGCLIAVMTLRNWRLGFYGFFVYMLFEDLVRKYMGNGTLLFFGKDVLLALVYISLYAEIRRGREKWFRFPFSFFLALFVWFGMLEVFNPHSPSILYGLLGLKVYFYYIPLMYVGYALIRSDNDVKNFLLVNAMLAVVIASLGIVQAIRGNSFLNPANLAPELRALGNLSKVTPMSGQLFSLPDSVFVSNGRFGAYLTVVLIIAIGMAGYFQLRTHRYRMLSLVALGTVGMATLLTGSRGSIVFALASTLFLGAAFLWGIPWRSKQAHRLGKLIRRSIIVAALGLTTLVLLFPKATGSRVAFYTQTLLPDSPAYALTFRAVNYPLENFMNAFSGHWVVGRGIGTASLGVQYVARLTGQPPPATWVEEGFGDLIVEMGVLAPVLWFLWTGALLYYSWRVVQRLRDTPFFPLAIAILWYAFILLYPSTYGALSSYQNYVSNIYLWLTIGILYRLPEIAATSRTSMTVPASQT